MTGKSFEPCWLTWEERNGHLTTVPSKAPGYDCTGTKPPQLDGKDPY